MFFSFSRTRTHHKSEEKRFTCFDYLQTFRIMYNLHNLKENIRSKISEHKKLKQN